MPALVDREMLRRVLTNIRLNAEEAIGQAESSPARPPGQIVVSCAPMSDVYVIDIDDNGPGIADAVLAHVFDPYMTTKRDGTGLGLSIVKKIVVDHGGTIDVLSSPLGGARFRIRIPRADSAAARAAVERSAGADELGASMR
jgi:signal transduction histidine kinase